MKRKTVAIIICMLIFILTLPTISSYSNKPNDVNISITAGHIGLDIGYGIHVKARKPENISMTFFVNITHSSIIGNRDNKYNWNFTCDEYQWGNIFKIMPKAFFNKVNVTVEVDTILAARDGFSIGKIIILS